MGAQTVIGLLYKWQIRKAERWSTRVAYQLEDFLCVAVMVDGKMEKQASLEGLKGAMSTSIIYFDQK